MATPSRDAIEAFLRAQYDTWNQSKPDEMMALFDQIAPNGCTVEFVGGERMDGKLFLQGLWAKLGSSVKIELAYLMVNGNEAATCAKNHHHSEDGYSITASIETYRFEDGKLHIRYFH